MNKVARRNTKRDWVYRNPEKELARRKAQEAKEKGLIKKEKCFVCGEKKTECHHPDYSKPLKVVWLCKKHHDQMGVESRKDKPMCYKYHKRIAYKKLRLFPEVKKLMNSGKKYKQISEKLNISRSQIWRWINNVPNNYPNGMSSVEAKRQVELYSDRESSRIYRAPSFYSYWFSP